MEIQITNFRESIKLAQRSVYVGLTLAALVHYLSSYHKDGEHPEIPFVGLKFATVDSF